MDYEYFAGSLLRTFVGNWSVTSLCETNHFAIRSRVKKLLIRVSHVLQNIDPHKQWKQWLIQYKNWCFRHKRMSTDLPVPEQCHLH